MITITKNTAIIHLIRLPNLLMILVSQYIAAIFIVFEHLSIKEVILRKDLFLLTMATILIAAAGNVINDYFDVKIDGINKPRKLIIDNFIKRRTALILHFILSLIGIGITYFLNLQITIICSFSSVFLWLYSYQLKRKPFVGNLMISLLTAIAVYFPALLFNQPNRILMVFALFAFFVSLIREILKDIEDMKGDGLFGCQTLPLVYGMRITKKIIIGITGVFMMSQLMIAIFSLNIKLLIISSLSFVVLVFFLQHLLPADTKKEFAALSKFCKWFMFAGILSMMFL